MIRGQQRSESESQPAGESAEEDKRQRAEDSRDNRADNFDQRQPNMNTEGSESGIFGSGRLVLTNERDFANWRVKKLTDICRNRCANNFSVITTLGDTRKCYFKLVEPILARMGSQQLRNLEENSYTELAQDTKQLWKALIEKDFPKHKFDDANTSYSDTYHGLEKELSSRRTKALENLKKNYEKHQSLKQSKSTIALNESASINLINLTVLKKRKRKLFSLDNKFKSPTMKKLHRDVQKVKINGPPLKPVNTPVYMTQRVPYPSSKVYQSSLYNRKPTILNKIKHDTVAENNRNRKSTMSFNNNNQSRTAMLGDDASSSSKHLKRSSLFDNSGSKRRIAGNSGINEAREEYKRPRVITSCVAPQSLAIPKKSILAGGGTTKNNQSRKIVQPSGSKCQALSGYNTIPSSLQGAANNAINPIVRPINYSRDGMAVYDPQVIAQSSNNRRETNNTGAMNSNDFASTSRTSMVRKGVAGASRNGKQKLVRSSLFK